MNTRLSLISVSTICLILLGNFISKENKQLYGASLNTVSIQKTLLAQKTTQLEYEFLGQKIPLTVKKDTTAVLFKPQKIDRSSGSDLYSIQLQEALADTTRNTNGSSERESQVEITPIGQNYALVQLAVEDEDISVIEANIQQQEYVQEVLPVLTISDSDSDKARDIILPNEIIVSFDEKLSEAERKALLKEQNLELIRPVRFFPSLYVVKSLTVSGVEVLQVANQLNSVTSIQSAAPNFIETLMEEISLNLPLSLLEGGRHKELFFHMGEGSKKEKEGGKKDDLAMNSSSNSLLPIQWHLNSSPLTSCLNTVQIKTLERITECSKNNNLVATNSNNRTDVRAIESWQNNNQGEGVVVAVIDTLIQWDHPDLINSTHQVDNKSQKLKGDSRGWDFVGGDNDTRLEADQVDIIRHFRNAFILDSVMIKWRYPKAFLEIKKKNPNASEISIIRTIRRLLLNQVAGRLFHGTTVAGVIAANPQNDLGVYGVAPKAKILPVTAGAPGFSAVNLIESLGYSVDEGADIINLSLGSKLPNLFITQAIQQLLRANPNLIIVAASGNDNVNALDYPAAIPEVIAVGATNMEGFRATYSDYGSDTFFSSKLTVVAPGGDFSPNGAFGGVLTTGGTAQPLLMDGINITGHWGRNWDVQGEHRWATGTSFATPVVSGVIALIKGEDTSNRLIRADIIDILQKTASYDQLKLRDTETRFFNKVKPANFNSPEEYFFGAGLVNAEAAMAEAKARLQK